MAKGSLRVNGIIVDTDGEIKASTGDSIVIREDDGSAVITVDTNGKTSIGGPMDVGVDDTGHDVKFFGATAGAYMEWDESADELEIRGGAATAGKLLLSTAETTVVDGNKLGQIDFQAPLDSAGTDAILVGASIHAEADATFSSSVNATELVFSTGASETAAEKMRITSDGKVGIGNATPATILDVADDLANGSGKTEVMRLYNGADIVDDGPYLVLATGMGDCRLGSYRQGYGGTEGGSSFYVSTAYNDGTGGSTSVVERFRVQANGKVGIGITSPDSKFHVEGTDPGSGNALIEAKLTNNSNNPVLQLINENAGGNATDNNGLFIDNRGGAGASLSIRVKNNAAEVFAVKANGRVGIGNSAPTNELTIGPDTPGADVGNAIEMRGSAGDSSLQRFQIYNNGASGKTEFKLGRSGNSPTTLLGIGPSDIEFTLPFIQTIATHQKIRQFYYTGSIANGNAVNLFRNTDAYSDVNGLYWFEATHSGRTYQTRAFTIGGYGFNHGGGATGGFDVTSTASGMPAATQALRLNNNTGTGAAVHIAGFIFGDNPITNISATIYD